MASSKCVGPPPATILGECLVVDYIELVNGRLLVRVVSPENESQLVEILKKNFSGVRESPPFSEIKAGDHFMGRLDIESGIILRRIQVTEAPGEDLDAPINCVDIDSGDALQVQWYNVFLLKDEAMMFPRQTFEVFPFGLELFFGTSSLSRIFDKPPQRYVLKVITTTADAPPVCHVTTAFGVRKEVQVVHLYYENAPLLSTHVVAEGRISSAFKCAHPKVGEAKKVILTHLLADGAFVYQYEKSSLIKSIQTFLEKVDTTHVGRLGDATNAKPDVLYLSKFEGILYRCQVLKIVDTDKVWVLYIDYGNEGEVQVRELIDAESVHKMLTLLPPQCLYAKMTGIGYMKRMDDFWEVTGTERFTLKVDHVPEGSSRRPRVSLYLKDTEEKSVNTILIEKGSAFAKKPKRKEVKEEVVVGTTKTVAVGKDVVVTPAQIASNLVSILRTRPVVTPAIIVPISSAVIAPIRPPGVVMPRPQVLTTSRPPVVVTPRPQDLASPRPQDLASPRPPVVVAPRPPPVPAPRHPFVAPATRLILPATSAAPAPLTPLTLSFDKNGTHDSDPVNLLATCGSLRLSDWTDPSEYFTPGQSDENELALFHVVQVFGNNLALQQHKSGSLVQDMETTLKEYLQIKVNGPEGIKPVKLVEQKWYAVLYPKLDKWARCVLLKKQILNGSRVAIFRLLDYGVWFALPLVEGDSARNVQELPVIFTHLKAQGVTASLSGLGKEGISAEMLGRLDKPFLVQVWIQKWFPPEDGRDIPHAKIAVLQILEMDEFSDNCGARKRLNSV